MLVSAFAGRELVLDAYHHAIQETLPLLQFWRCHVYLLIFTIKKRILSGNKTLIVCVLLWIKIELIYSQARIFQTLDTGIDNRADN